MRKLLAIVLIVVALGGCEGSAKVDDHEGDVKIEGNK